MCVCVCGGGGVHASLMQQSVHCSGKNTQKKHGGWWGGGGGEYLYYNLDRACVLLKNKTKKPRMTAGILKQDPKYIFPKYILPNAGQENNTAQPKTDKWFSHSLYFSFLTILLLFKCCFVD